MSKKSLINFKLQYRFPIDIVKDAACIYWDVDRNYFDTWKSSDKDYKNRLSIVIAVLYSKYAVGSEEILRLFNLPEEGVRVLINNSLSVINFSGVNPYREQAYDIMSICDNISFDNLDISIVMDVKRRRLDVCTVNYNLKND